MEPQVKKDERPESARSQSKTSPPLGERRMKAMKPKASAKIMATHGRPCLSTLLNHLGAMPCMARAWSVRVEPKVHELATEMTERVMTAFMMEGRTLILASWKARTKGEYLELAPDALDKSGSSDLMIRPRMKSETT